MHLPRVRLDRDKDQDIINWLSNLEGYGSKSQAIRRVIRHGLQALSKGSPSTAPCQPTNPLPNYNELLGDIRRVMDASLENALGNLSLTHLETQAEEIDDDFDEFASLMMLEED